MRVWRRVLLGVVVLAVAAPAVFVVRTLDGMALAYTTGLRRAPGGPGFLGVESPRGGPTPGIVFLGRATPAEGSPGFVMRRVSAEGREAGLHPGDRVVRVDGVAHDSMASAMQALIRDRHAGDDVEFDIVRDEEPMQLTVRLAAFVRDPADLGLPFEEVEFDSASGFRLRGWWIPPPEGSDGRSVVWVHGAHSSRFQALDHGADHLRNRGYGLLTFDLSGRGSSEGRYITYTWNERHDVEAAVRFVRKRSDADPRRVVVFGTSNGASSAIYAAAALGDLPALALDAPYADLWRAAGSMLEERGGHPALRAPLALLVRLRTGARIRQVRPIEAVSAFPGRVLFIHGEQDTQIPPEHSLELHERRLAAGLPSLRWVLPGGEHGFDHYPPEGILWSRVGDFFDDALGGRAPGWELGGPAPDTLEDPTWADLPRREAPTGEDGGW